MRVTDMHMISVGTGGCKKRKREERVFKFKTFCHQGHPTHFDGPFRRNIQALLEHGKAEWRLFGGMQSWSFWLEVHRHPPVHVSLFIIEEPIEIAVHRHCHHCRCAGWGHHMICNRRFHFVLPSKETLAASTSGSCQGTRGVTGAEAAAVMPVKQQQQTNFVELQGHLMHAVMHSNGFGHLLCLNGMEGGSEFLPGHQIMDFWNRICTGLRARKVSLSDTAKKRRLELRLIHGIGYGEPWFGRWGYQFGRGSYGITQQTYHKAIQALRAIPLRMLTSILPEVSAILLRYQTMSGNSLQTLGHLFHYILELRSRIPLHSLTSADPPHHGITADSNNCRWSSKRVEMAICVIVEALKKAGFRWVSRQEVRDAARLYIGDTGLLDFVLKSLGNHVVGNYVVRRAVNPVTKVLEYCLEDVYSTTAIFPHQSLPLPAAIAAEDPKTKVPPPRLHVTRAQLMKDIHCLYKHVLTMEQRFTAGVLEAIPAAVRIVLDVKRLVKDYRGEMLLSGKNAGEELMEIMCTISLRQGDHHDIDSSSPPHEPIVLPNHATLGDLKREVETCFREMYWCLRSFTAESVVGLDGRRDGDLLYGLVEAGASVVVRGWSGLEEDTGRGRSCEGGNTAIVWMMDCPCGAKEDDGERMISCDICEVWQHTRCVGVSDEFPQQIFLCSQCEQKIVIVPPLL